MAIVTRSGNQEVETQEVQIRMSHDLKVDTLEVESRKLQFGIRKTSKKRSKEIKENVNWCTLGEVERSGSHDLRSPSWMVVPILGGGSHFECPWQRGVYLSNRVFQRKWTPGSRWRDLRSPCWMMAAILGGGSHLKCDLRSRFWMVTAILGGRSHLECP